jgi:hypothetical protein
MKLDQMYLNFTQVEEPAQVLFIEEYRKKRFLDLSQIVTKTKTSTSKIDITEDEKVMMKLLGLKMKDIVALRAIGPLEEEEESGDLFDDNGLVEGDEL